MQDNSTRQIHIKLPPHLHRILKVAAAVRETTIQEYVVEAIESKVTKEKKKHNGN